MCATRFLAMPMLGLGLRWGQGWNAVDSRYAGLTQCSLKKMGMVLPVANLGLYSPTLTRSGGTEQLLVLVADGSDISHEQSTVGMNEQDQNLLRGSSWIHRGLVCRLDCFTVHFYEPCEEAEASL